MKGDRRKAPRNNFNFCFCVAARLKGDLKRVVAELRGLSDEVLTAAQANGGAITVCGHELGAGDLLLKYEFDSKNKQASHQYEAHSTGDVSTSLMLFRCVVCILSSSDAK